MINVKIRVKIKEKIKEITRNSNSMICCLWNKFMKQIFWSKSDYRYYFLPLYCIIYFIIFYLNYQRVIKTTILLICLRANNKKERERERERNAY